MVYRGRCARGGETFVLDENFVGLRGILLKSRNFGTASAVVDQILKMSEKSVVAKNKLIM